MKALTAVIALCAALPVSAATARNMDPRPPRPSARVVSMDVKDGEARDVLKMMQRQCGIKNLVIDPDVAGKATFYFREVPCATAFDTVLTTFHLKAVVYSDSVASVEKIR